ncbi:MAG: four helix bundle protein [Crocinitomicaceae bacterium]
MKFSFENLNVWNRSMDIAEEIYEMIKKFPDQEKFNLSSQILRASDSIALNISEGTIRTSKLEFKRFIGYSIRSLAEVVTCLHKARRRCYIDADQFDKLYTECYHLMNMLIAFQHHKSK